MNEFLLNFLFFTFISILSYLNFNTIRLWLKRRNDDNFKISLSQIFLQSSSSSYFNDISNNPNGKIGKKLSLEDELCELLHENSQLKNFLKEKEDIIKILQEKIRTAKQNFSRLYQENFNEEKKLENIDTNVHQNEESAVYFSPTLDQNQIIHTFNPILNPLDTGYEVNSTTSTATTTTETFKTNETSSKISKSLILNQLSPNTEKLRNDLDEVEELTTRVRDSISLDLSNTRRYSPLLYEYYRKQIELAKSIQCTYNIQCNTLFDAMTLMRKCLKDYSKTVHNPEYLAIDEIGQPNPNQYTYNDFLVKNNQKFVNQSIFKADLKADTQEYNVYSSINNLKKSCFLIGNSFEHQTKQGNSKQVIEVSTTGTESTQSTEASSSTLVNSLPNDTKNDEQTNTTKDNKQTYV